MRNALRLAAAPYEWEFKLQSHLSGELCVCLTACIA